MAVPHPSLLSFSSSLRASTFFMSARRNDGHRTPVVIESSGLSGLFQHHIKREEAEKRAKNPETNRKANPVHANPQITEFAMMPPDTHALIVEGSLLITNALKAPESCNLPEFSAAYAAFYQAALGSTLIPLLAERYVMNLITGQWLWRNRALSDDISIQVSFVDRSIGKDEVTLTFKANDYAEVLWPTRVDELGGAQQGDGRRLVNAFIDALSNTYRSVLRLRVTATINGLFPGDPVYPSQDMVMRDDKKKSNGSDEKPEVSRLLFSVQVPGTTIRQAAMTDRKIGNALRTADWAAGNDQPPIAFSAYGTVSRQGRAIHLENGRNDFYTLLVKLDDLTQECRQLNGAPPSDDLIFMAGMFIMGGLFGQAKEQDSKAQPSKGRTSKATSKAKGKSPAVATDTAEASDAADTDV